MMPVHVFQNDLGYGSGRKKNPETKENVNNLNFEKQDSTDKEKVGILQRPAWQTFRSYV